MKVRDPAIRWQGLFAHKSKNKPSQNYAETSSIDGSTPAASNHEIHHVDDEKHSFHEEADVEKGTTQLESGIEQGEEASRDPNIVDWDGPDDPENPLNWTVKRKVTATVSIALITLLTYDPPGSPLQFPAHINS